MSPLPWLRRFVLRGLRCAALLALAGPAFAIPGAAPIVELQLGYDANVDFVGLDLTGTATVVRVEFGAAGGPRYVPVGSFTVALTVGEASATTFIPTDPCVGDGSCEVGFLFSGFTGSFETYAFTSLDAAPATRPDAPPIMPVGTFMPGDPCVGAGVCRAGGPLVAYRDGPVAMGHWDVAIQAAPVPEPASAVLALLGVGGLALARRRAARRD